MSLPPQPTLHRSWLLRGTFSPSPWGKSMSGLLEETQVAFYRTVTRRTEMGGWEGTGQPLVFLTAMCHVELEETEDAITQPSVGLILKRNWFLSMGIPASSDLIPQAGDRIRFNDPAGLPVDLALVKADLPEGVLDHLEMASESWTV